MNTSQNYVISVSIQLPMSSEVVACNIELAPEFHEEFRSIKTCSDDTPMALQMITGERYEFQKGPLIEDRSKLASRLSLMLAEELTKLMGENDTHNGYKKN